MISHFLECKCLDCSIPLPRHPGSWHVSDGISRFSSGNLRWKSQVATIHTEKSPAFNPCVCANPTPRQATSICLMSPSSIWLLQKRSSNLKGKLWSRGCNSNCVDRPRFLSYTSFQNIRLLWPLVSLIRSLCCRSDEKHRWVGKP